MRVAGDHEDDHLLDASEAAPLGDALEFGDQLRVTDGRDVLALAAGEKEDEEPWPQPLHLASHHGMMQVSLIHVMSSWQAWPGQQGRPLTPQYFSGFTPPSPSLSNSTR